MCYTAGLQPRVGWWVWVGGGGEEVDEVLANILTFVDTGQQLDVPACQHTVGVLQQGKCTCSRSPSAQTLPIASCCNWNAQVCRYMAEVHVELPCSCRSAPFCGSGPCLSDRMLAPGSHAAPRAVLQLPWCETSQQLYGAGRVLAAPVTRRSGLRSSCTTPADGEAAAAESVVRVHGGSAQARRRLRKFKLLVAFRDMNTAQQTRAE